MRVVLDTNMLISALIMAGKPRELLLKIIKDKARLVLSKPILDEFIRIAGDPKVRKYIPEEDLIAFIKDIGASADIIKVKSKYKAVATHPPDDIIVNTGWDGKADYLVSGDRHLLELRKFKRVKMVTVDEMLKILK